MPRPPRSLALVAALVSIGATCAAAQVPAPAPRAPAIAIDAERLRRDVEDATREAMRAAEEAGALRWSALAQAGESDFEWDLDPEGAKFAFIAREFGSTRDIVKNAPYQAEAVNESVQTLPDGNRIVRRSSTFVARDGYGRTRQEKKDGVAYVFDPIDNRSYALNPDRKTAVRIPRAPSLVAPPAPLPPAPPAPPGAAAAPPAPPPPPVAGATPGAAPKAVERRVIVRRSADGKDIEVEPGRVVVKRSGAGGNEVEDVRIEVVRIGRDGQGAHEAPPLPPLALPLLPRGKGESKPLGTREFDGVKAEGTMTTHTIPAGEIGNEKPIVVTSERWFSPELHLVVYAKNSDPRTGDTIFRLANLKRGEPPAGLFKVPADYKVRK